MPPRIAHVISSPRGFGGAERVLTDIVLEGTALGWEQLVLHPFAADGGTELAAALGDVVHQPLPARRFRDLPRVRRSLFREIDLFEPDVIHAHLFHAGVMVAAIRHSGSASVWTHHHGSVMRDDRRWMLSALDRAATARFDMVVAVSDSVNRFLTEENSVPRTRVQTIRNGWQGKPWPRTAHCGPPVILSVAMFRPEKDHATLLKAFQHVRATCQDARLVLVGAGPLQSSLQGLTRSLGLTGAVEFAGQVGDVWPLLASADVFALASVHEPLGIAVQEAMAAGLATVTTNAGGLSEIVIDGETGLMVPPRDPEALGDALITLLKDPAQREAMGAAGRRAADSMRSSAMVSNYYALYGELCDLTRARKG